MKKRKDKEKAKWKGQGRKSGATLYRSAAKGMLHEKAEACRAWARSECAKLNRQCERTALRGYEKWQATELFREDGAFAVGLLVERLNRIHLGEASYPIREGDAETIVRMMTANAAPQCVRHEFDETLSDRKTVRAQAEGKLVRTTVVRLQTDASKMQHGLFRAFSAYAREAAIYARHIASDSLLQWAEIADATDGAVADGAIPATEAFARRLLERERAAADRLRIDRYIASLPTFHGADGAD